MYELVLNVHTDDHRGTTCPYVLLGLHIFSPTYFQIIKRVPCLFGFLTTLRLFLPFCIPSSSFCFYY